jgi:hypothetical protein
MFVWLLVFWEGINLWNVQCNLLKWKLQDNSVSSFQTVSCNRQLPWYIPLIQWLPTGGYAEEQGKRTVHSSQNLKCFSCTALDGVECRVYCWCELANLFSSSELQESRALWAAVSSLMCLYCEEQATTQMYLSFTMLSWQSWRRRLHGPPNVNHFYHPDILPLSEASAVKT